MDFKTVALTISDDVAEVMDERGIREEDIREVLEYAETTGKKMYVEGEEHFLSKKRIGNFTANVEYILGADCVEIVTVYSHMVTLASEEEEG